MVCCGRFLLPSASDYSTLVTMLRRIFLRDLSIVLLTGILLAGALLRFSALKHGLTYHPDERHMIMVTMDLSDHGMNPRSFAYGSLSYYLLWFTAKFATLFNPALFSYDNLFIIGRTICVVGGLLGIALTYFLSREIYQSVGIALVAASLLAFNTFHIQLSRFFTSDILLSTLCLGLLFALVRYSKTGSRISLGVCGVLFGLATATKISSVFLIPSLALALLLSPRSGSWKQHLLLCVLRGVGIGAIGFITFAIVEPFALLDFQTFLQHTREQTDMVQGKWRPPYTIQYEHTTPYLYPLAQMFFYTMGIPLAVAVGGGCVAAIIRQRRNFNPGEWILAGWIITLFAVTAGFQVKFPRYLMPIYPELFVFAAVFLWQLGGVICSAFGVGLSQPQASFEQSMANWHKAFKASQLSSLATSEYVAPRVQGSSKAVNRFKILAAAFLSVVLVTVELYLYVRARSPRYSDSPSEEGIPVILDSDSRIESDKAALSINQVPDLPNVSERGGFGTSLSEAMAIAVNSLNETYIVDIASHTLSKFGPQGEPLFSFGGKGTEPWQFNEPRGIDLDSQGNVYVMDTWNGRVQKFAPDGRFLIEWGTEQGLFGPRAIAVKGGEVYVVDSGGGRVVVYSEDGSFLRTFGKRGGKPGEFIDPVGVAATDDGAVYVLDSGNDRVQKFDSDGSVSKILSVPGWISGGLKEAHLAFSEGVGLFVVDPISGSVLLYDVNDVLVGRIARRLQSPTGVSVENATVTVLERHSGKVVRWELGR
jgi:4-amino-4-deoxy-L-arabinose transferase-like glycosyltransferase